MTRLPLTVFLTCALAAATITGCATTPEQYNQAGLLSFQTRDYHSALSAFQQAGEMDPTNA